MQKLSATKLALKYGITTVEVQRRLIQMGYVRVETGIHYFTELGKRVGGELRKNHPEARDTEGHMVWPVDIFMNERLTYKLFLQTLISVTALAFALPAIFCSTYAFAYTSPRTMYNIGLGVVSAAVVAFCVGVGFVSIQWTRRRLAKLSA